MIACAIGRVAVVIAHFPRCVIAENTQGRLVRALHDISNHRDVARSQLGRVAIRRVSLCATGVPALS
jgi:hypothetical protein